MIADLRFGVQDLASRKVWVKHRGCVQVKVVLIALAAFSSSFGKARNVADGTSPVRDTEHVTGLPDLSPADPKKVLRG